MNLFTHGFNETKLQGYLACYLKHPHGLLVELINEIKMLYTVDTGMGHGFDLQEPPPRQMTTVDPRHPNMTIDGVQIRALAKEIYAAIKGNSRLDK